MVFTSGIDGAKHAVKSMIATVKSPKDITVKFDGYPALVFGRNNEGKFSIMDKHMFSKKDGSGREIFSPQDFVNYDRARGVDRGDLYEIIRLLWKGLEKECREKGYYWGDLLFRQRLQEQNNVYRFKANPKGITYTVDVDSDLGKLISGKDAGIAVHQYIPAEAISTDQATSLNGTIGNLTNSANIAIIPSKLPISPNLQLSKTNLEQVNSDIRDYKDQINNLLSSLPIAKGTFTGTLSKFITSKIKSGNLDDLVSQYFQFIQSASMSDKMRQTLVSYLSQHKEGIVGIFKLWVGIYKLKMELVDQLENATNSGPVKGYLDDNTPSHEGFVSHGIKLINRLGFTKNLIS